MKKYILYCLSLLMLSVAPVAAQEDDSELMDAPRKEKPAKPRKQYPTRVVKGRVLNAATKAPISGAMVRCHIAMAPMRSRCPFSPRRSK